MSEHLDFQTDFLDKNTLPKKGASVRKPNMSDEEGGTTKYNWKKILIIGGIILFFGWVIFSDSGSSTSNSTHSPTTNSNNLLTGSGQTFSCSNYNYDRAIALQPNSGTVAQLNSESTALDARASAIKSEQSRVDNMYVDEYDQDSLDVYNAAVDSFNLKNNRLKSDITSWNSRNDAYNRQIDTYNNFLDTNCTPQ